VSYFNVADVDTFQSLDAWPTFIDLRWAQIQQYQNCLRRWRAGYAPRFMAASVDDKLADAPRFSIAVLPFENLTSDKETRTISPT
jgi:hypothetical protein